MLSTKTSPFFPGYDFRSATGTNNKPKNQTLTVVHGLMKTTMPDPNILDIQIEETKKKLAALQGQQPDATQRTSFVPDLQPNEPQEAYTLRFYGYFQQSLTESPGETYRIRYVNIYVYTEDDTVMIEEQKSRNSGMTQGVLLRRMRVQNPNAEPYGSTYIVQDFQIGVNIDISGIVYHIYDCDQFTRQYMESIGIQLADSEQAPEDLYTIKRKLTERPIRVSHCNPDPTNLANFLKYDGKVLRFYAVWDDSKNLFGEKRKFVIIYFLVDGRIEIRQVNEPSSGRDPVARFLAKTVLKNPRTGQPYSDQDLMVGETVTAFGRNFLIYDADEFTKQFLDDKYGIHDWTPIKQKDPLDVSLATSEAPPYNGWGDEEDSLGYCHSLHPKPPRKNIVKLLNNDGKVLRFKAEFKNPNPVDDGRIFVIAFYTADDKLAIFESPRRNSGFQGGKFIQKGTYKNMLAGRNFIAQDFYVGAEIMVNSYRFILTDADEYAYNQMEAEPEEYPVADLSAIIENLRKNTEGIEKLRKEMEAQDPELKGLIPKDDAQKLMVRVLRLQYHQAITIARRYSDDKNMFNYFDFVGVFTK
ncbi:MGC84469 protein, putative [Trichomonas vaginalis G3]|uniref:MGC84469 protein, putative n=1 Tax=Trichomonas vaginalis (strain ATCC PRA-98 / G3) TaxID=412133 RepID=A2DJ77_TRIV3|nr:EF-Hand domain C-terminal containing protein family [Trichomonas vaginalis G3]EAY19464.1 MGC84469 protein, putative [Trichomonas vaginalis G3]KAI5520057.1 EF-Hand domain C-terminal containing protein family [Trichomonas vaginalis G3]|eukprot:XP_001580450.1 MGC84469 protein [Trichomonas vaginalis G3]